VSSVLTATADDVVPAGCSVAEGILVWPGSGNTTTALPPS
jgi:hypothetical protein